MSAIAPTLAGGAEKR